MGLHAREDPTFHKRSVTLHIPPSSPPLKGVSPKCWWGRGDYRPWGGAEFQGPGLTLKPIMYMRPLFIHHLGLCALMVGWETLHFTGKSPLQATGVTRGDEGLEWLSWINHLGILVEWGWGANFISADTNTPCFPHSCPNWRSEPNKPSVA